jgi:hypothetical protein
VTNIKGTNVVFSKSECKVGSTCEFMRFNLLPFSPRLIQARWVFGKLPGEEIPGLAQNALELGYDGKIIRRLAGLINPDHFELQRFMPAFLAKLHSENAFEGRCRSPARLLSR